MEVSEDGIDISTKQKHLQNIFFPKDVIVDGLSNKTWVSDSQPLNEYFSKESINDGILKEVNFSHFLNTFGST